MMELHIKHVATVMAKHISGRDKTGPTNTLFKRLQDNWPEMLPLIDISDLNKFNWKDMEGTEIEDKAMYNNTGIYLIHQAHIKLITIPIKSLNFKMIPIPISV